MLETWPPHLTQLHVVGAAEPRSGIILMVINPPIQPLNAECQAGWHWVPFFTVFGMTRPGSRTPNLLVTGWTL